MIGVGGSGSSIAYHLAKSGRKVLGLEQFKIAHDQGSSHGETRIIRLAYHEGEFYVPLLRRAYELWRELEKETAQKVLTTTGCLNIGPAESSTFRGCLESAQRHKISHEVLDADEVMSRFPAFQLGAYMKAVFQPDGGFLEPERCVSLFAREAVRHGAEINEEERVKSWESSGATGVEVHTKKRSYKARRIVFSSGAWTQKLVAELGVPIVPERQVVGWFRPLAPELFALGRLPVWILSDEGRSPFGDESSAYGFPVHNIPGFKFGVMHHRREAIDPDYFQREPTPEDEKFLRTFLNRFFPKADGDALKLGTCIFTNTPNHDFLLDFHPKYPQAIIVSCCSGHGFKFTSVIGELVEQMSNEGKTKLNINRFSFRSHEEEANLHS